jgi:ribosome-associated protein
VPGRRVGSDSSLDAALGAARAATGKQAQDLAILDVHGLIVITDYFVICSGTSERHVRTIVDEVERSLRDLDRKPIRREGETEGRWVLLDYVDIVVHVFAEEEREYYDLERLWRDAPRVPFAEPGRAAGGSVD